MEVRTISLVLFVTLAFSINPLYAEMPVERHTHLGVALDRNPLPELLTKHLQLSEGQGLLIKNIYIDSPADKTGLDKDDIITGFEGKEVFGYEGLVEQIQEAGAGTVVKIEIIHLGKKKTVKVKLERLDRETTLQESKWKYPYESEVSEMWRPGRIFRFRPGEEDWTQVPLKEVPEIKMDIKQFFKEKYFFQHTYDDDEFSVTIEGNPDDASSTVTLEISKKNERKTYITTIGEISELPKKYLSTIKKDIEEARKTPPHEHDMRQSHEDFEKAHQDMLKAHKDIEKAQSELKEIQEDLFKEFKVKIPKAEFFRQKFRSYGFDDKFEELQEQMEELMKRMAELEESAVKSKEHSEEAESEAKEEQI